MKTRVLIIGGYGNFGSYIAKRLAENEQLDIFIGGRNIDKGRAFAKEIGATAITLDINHNFVDILTEHNPQIVIHTSGPFQGQDYHVAQCCIDAGCHYIDLADGRHFVNDITQLNYAAKAKSVYVISGASSVPCLTSALIDSYIERFARLEHVEYVISTAQKTNRGLATTAAILGYTGKPFTTLINGVVRKIYGWQNIRLRKYPNLGWRMLSNCDIPDLELFPTRYPQLKTIHFYAGLEIPLLHLGLWGLSWLVRLKLIKSLQGLAPLMLKASYAFDRFGSANSGFHMTLSGKDAQNKPMSINFELTARDGDGPYIPCMPAILLTQKLASGELTGAGAQPCIGLISKDEYLNALKPLHIEWSEQLG